MRQEFLVVREEKGKYNVLDKNEFLYIRAPIISVVLRLTISKKMISATSLVPYSFIFLIPLRSWF